MTLSESYPLPFLESDPLDQAGDFLGRGPALWDCGIHAWGFIFPWRAGTWVTHQEADSAAICLPRRGSGRPNVSQVNAGFSGHAEDAIAGRSHSENAVKIVKIAPPNGRRVDVNPVIGCWRFNHFDEQVSPERRFSLNARPDSATLRMASR